MNDSITVRYELDDRHVATWRDEVCDRLLDADTCWGAAQRLGVRFGVTAIAGVVLLDAHAHAPGLAIARTAARVARASTPPTLGLTLCASGEAAIASGGREHVVRAGELCLLSSAEPFTKRMSADYRELFLYLPAPVAVALGRPTPGLVDAPRVAARRGLAAMLADAVVAMAQVRAELEAAAWQTAVGAVFELATGVFGQSPEPARTGCAAREAQRARALRDLDAHLAEPALSPPAIAAALGVSPRYLHRLFESGPSVGATILARRLERCHAALRDEREPRSISELAFAWGFNDAAHFSRSFRARFGVAPRELRASLRAAAQ